MCDPPSPLTPLRTSSCVQEQMVRGGSVGTWICNTEVSFPPLPPHYDIIGGGESTMWTPHIATPPPIPGHDVGGVPHPHGAVGGGGVQRALILPQPRDLQAVPHIEALQWGQ